MNQHDGRHDFDFLIGRWRVLNHQLLTFDPGCREWREFPTTCTARSILGGLGNIDFFSFAGTDTRPAWEASTVRLYEPATDTWRIYWASSAYPGPFGAPMEGRFAGGIGTFHGEDSYDGRQVDVRFRWTHQDGNHARWEQSIRFPRRADYQVNWIMEFTRHSGSAPSEG